MASSVTNLGREEGPFFSLLVTRQAAQGQTPSILQSNPYTERSELLCRKGTGRAKSLAMAFIYSSGVVL